jgi:hypothetical protein
MTLGVGRSLSSVDNIGCLHHRPSDNRFGGIRLESDEPEKVHAHHRV